MSDRGNDPVAYTLRLAVCVTVAIALHLLAVFPSSNPAEEQAAGRKQIIASFRERVKQVKDEVEKILQEAPPPPEEPPPEEPEQEAPEQEAPAQEAPEQEAPAQEQAPEQEAPEQEAPEQEAPEQEEPPPPALEEPKEAPPVDLADELVTALNRPPPPPVRLPEPQPEPPPEPEPQVDLAQERAAAEARAAEARAAEQRLAEQRLAEARAAEARAAEARAAEQRLAEARAAEARAAAQRLARAHEQRAREQRAREQRAAEARAAEARAAEARAAEQRLAEQRLAEARAAEARAAEQRAAAAQPAPLPPEIGSETVLQRDARIQRSISQLDDYSEFATTAREEVEGKIPAIFFTNDDEDEWMALIAYFDLLPIAYAKSDPSYYVTIDVARRQMNHTRDFDFIQQRYGRNGMIVRQLGSMPQFAAAARMIMSQFSIRPSDLTIQFLLPRPFAAYLNWKALKTCHEQRLDPATVKACRGRLVREAGKWVWRVDDLLLEDGRTTRVRRGG